MITKAMTDEEQCMRDARNYVHRSGASMSTANDNYQALLDDAVDMRGKIAALEAHNRQLREALKFYSNSEDYPLAIMELSGFKLLKDGGKRARAALDATEPKEPK